MNGIRVTGPADGETALSGPVSLRILEDGSATAHRLGVAEIVIAPHTAGPPQHPRNSSARRCGATPPRNRPGKTRSPLP